MIENDIREYAKQFAYEPKVENTDRLQNFESIVIGGMGGSGLVAGILRAIKPELDVVAHHEYGLPTFVDGDTEKRLFIAVSHSGGTEEAIDFCRAAINRGLQTAVIAAKGELLEIAQENNLPYINLPGDDTQPRMAMGYALRAILKLIHEDGLYVEAGKLNNSLDPLRHEARGKEIAEKIFGSTPIIYASRSNQVLAYNWKIKLNETGKVPAFHNTFPELNHNEMQGFAAGSTNEPQALRPIVIFLEDKTDHPRIGTRMKFTSDLYTKNKIAVEHIEIEGKTRLERIFNTLILGDWVAYYTALKHGSEPEQVPAIESFKKALNA